MVFSVLERLMVLSLIPKEGDLETLRTGKRLRPLFAFSDDESKSLNFVSAGGDLKWNEKSGVEPKEIELTHEDACFIRDSLIFLSESKKLTEHHLTLCDKFLE